ncbi:hypothetical protein [Chryseobacterium potabilaquae]|uniref:Thiol-activated cytolysin n=1 Tax=Chryseobacterium potabilaquae TaxID=2675057 RepID=A0A6N4X8L7_9FLAO|nr:hypothetical protein [Chryseobacterium potabilaquae]CAA7194721.1 hypothetical protein CHRY9293_01012 [Chryseobacterium potabilaquae]
MKNLYLIFVIAISVLQTVCAQSNAVKKFLQEQEIQQKKDFPLPLSQPFPNGTLGEKLQSLYELQAKEACGIIRTDKRMYIPKEIVANYGENNLRKTTIYDIPISATNLLFLVLTPSDILKINNGTFVEQEFINAKRIIGISDNLVNFGQSALSPINGFPSLFYQKSCGSYFVGDATAKVKAPVAELEASLAAETQKTTSITSVTGNFFSPLYLILRQNTAQSTYTHLLIWEIYYNHYKNNPSNTQPLYSNAKYISELKGTLTNRAINSSQSINMNGRLSANISFGLLNASGQVNAGNENKASFDLKDFSTSIHKLSNGNLNWELTKLPSIEEINQKLQNSQNYKAQPSIGGFATHLLPTEITRVLVGVPSSLCDNNSWEVTSDGFNGEIWKQKPTVVSSWIAKENEYPECICKITGFIKKEAIDNAIKSNGFIGLSLKLNSKDEMSGKKLSIDVSEPTVKVTDNPKISNVNSESINASKQEVKIAGKIGYNFPIQFNINATNIQLTEPYKISNIQIEYINKENENYPFSIINGPIVNGNTVSFDLKSLEKPQNYIQQGDIIIPIKIKFNIEIRGGTTTQLVTNIINLNLPNLTQPIEAK